jgi:hypothetical protein
VRFVCTDVWPLLYQVLSLRQPDALRVWCLPKHDALALLPPGTPLRSTIEHFYASVMAYYGSAPTVDSALAVLRDALAFCAAARDWWLEMLRAG